MITSQWFQFLHNLWLRTGGASAAATIGSLVTQVNTLIAQMVVVFARLATLDTEVAALQVTTDTLGSYVAQEVVPNVPESDPALVAWLVGDA